MSINLMATKVKESGKSKATYNCLFDNNVSVNGNKLGDGSGIVIHIPSVAKQFETHTPNDKGNRVLNVYYKFSDVFKFCGNAIYAG